MRSLLWVVLVAAALVHAPIASAQKQQQYQARPVITSLDPAAGPPGARVKIIGKNFTPEYKVYYNGVELPPVSGSPTEIVVQIPANAVQGRFTLKGPIHQVVSPQVFWVVQSKVAPVITSVSPLLGPPGTVVTITGNNFSIKSHENVVLLGTAAFQVRSASASKIEAVVPVGAQTGHITIQVYNAGQATAPQSFTVLAQLKIDKISPSASPPGTKVTLIGSGFSAEKKDVTVKLGTKDVPVVKASPTELVVEIPAKGVETGRFSVSVKGLGTYEHPDIFPLVYPPTIASFAPDSGPIGTEVTLKGKNFGNDASKVKITLSGFECPVKTLMGGNEVVVTIPQGAVSSAFKVAIPQMGESESAKAFEVWAPLAVTRMEPLWGLPGTEVRLWGTGFRTKTADHTLLIGSTKVNVDRIENGVLVFKIPKEAPDGQVALMLEVKDRGATQVQIPLTVVHSPEITSIVPSRGYSGMPVTVNGNYFATQVNHVQVLLGGLAVPISAVTPTSLTFIVPQGARTGKIEVKTKRRGSALSARDFEVYVPVQVTSILPSMGIAGQSVTIFGNGFDPVAKKNTVTLADKKVTVVEASINRIKVTVPKGASTGRFRVEVAERGFSESPQEFTIVEQLAVKSFEPANGTPGAYVAIKGKGFANQGLRGYIGNTPIGVRVDSPTQVTIAVPPGATTGKFVFTAPGAGRAESTESFKVLTPLVVTGFRPTFGA